MHIKGGIQRLMPVAYREVQIRGNAPIPIPTWPHPLSTQLGSHTKFRYPTSNMDQLQILMIHLSPCLIARPI